MKVQWDIENVDSLSDALCRPELIRALMEQGVEIGHYSNPDFVFAMANGLKEVKPKTIAFEKLDGCQIKNRGLLDNPNLLRLVKMYYYEDYKDNNKQCIDGRLFTRHLTKKKFGMKASKPPITKDQHGKVTAGISFLHYTRQDNLMRYAEYFLPADKPRIIDVYFGGTTTYNGQHSKSGKLIERHRMDCINAIKGLQGLNTHTTVDRAYSPIDYFGKLLSTKIVVSPWGWGEACYRDYEALALGCELIKPACPHIVSRPDIYNSRYVNWCAPDFSDLGYVVERIISTYAHTHEKREANAEALVSARSYANQASIIRNIIEEAEG